MVLLSALLACSSPKPADTAGTGETGETGDTGESGESGETGETGKAVPVDCAQVTGTGSIGVIGRGDTTTVVLPAAPATGTEQAVGFTGPDGAGRYFLQEPTGEVKRSDDGGCSWATVGALPMAAMAGDTGGGPNYVYYDLFSSRSSTRVYAYRPEHLYATDDGATWTEVGAPLLRAPAELVIDPADATRLRGYAPDGIVTSTDGGASWSKTPVPDPDDWYNAAIDAANMDRIALSAGGLWVATDGLTWEARDPELWAVLAWDAGTLYSLHRDTETAALRIRRSEDLGVSFTDLPVETDPDANISELAADEGLVLSGGYWYRSGEGVSAVVQVSTDAGTIVHKVPGYDGVVGFGFGVDRVVVALASEGIATPD